MKNTRVIVYVIENGDPTYIEKINSLFSTNVKVEKIKKPKVFPALTSPQRKLYNAFLKKNEFIHFNLLKNFFLQKGVSAPSNVSLSRALKIDGYVSETHLLNDNKRLSVWVKKSSWLLKIIIINS